MHITVEVDDDPDGRTTVDLYRWLRSDSDLRRTADVALRTRGVSGAMGAVEIINIVLTQGIAALNLAVTYASWRVARPAAPAVTIDFPGGSITVRDGGEETVRRIVEALREDPTGDRRQSASPQQDHHRTTGEQDERRGGAA
ncbi:MULTISPECIES: hypothetical protein [unclassified Streptomyces]|uniref:effector-associated constant component EACC1 n=1 Tax=unclassified Streptomyces TaxID=2593676 RepID=UPI00365CDCBD